MSRKILNQRQIGVLIRETVEKKLEEQQIKEGAAAFRRSVLQNLAEEMMEKEHDFSQIEEGMMGDLWDKAKGFIGGSNKQQASFTNAVEKATNKRTQEFFNQLEDAAPGFPNTKGAEKFEVGLALLHTTYTLLAKEASAAESKAERITAAAAATDLANYAQEAAGDFSRTFKYMKEDEEAPALFLEALTAEVIQEDVFGVSLKFLDKFFDAATTAAQGGKPIPKGILRKIGRMNNKLEREIANKGMENLGPRERRAWEEMKKFRDESEAANLDHHRDVMDAIGDDGGTAGAGGGGGGGASAPDVDPRDASDLELEPGETDSYGNYSDPDWDPNYSDPGPGMEPELGFSPDAGEAASEAGGSMISVLGVPMASKLVMGLGLGLGAAAVAFTLYQTYKYLKKKRAAGDSREGMLKSVVSRMKPIQPDFSGIDTLVPDPGEQEQKQAAETAPGAEGGEKTVNVFKGKGGAGMQSTLAKGGISGKDMSGLLKGLKADLSAAGFTVLQEASRETISLTNTLAAVQQIADAGQQEAAKAAIVALLRKHSIKGDNEFSMAMRPGAAGAEQGAPTPGAAGGSHLQKWIGAGKPDMDTWAKANQNKISPVTRESDNYADANANVLKAEALELAKLQLAWLQKSGRNDPNMGLLTTAIEATEAAGPQSSEPPAQAADAPVQGEPPQGETPAGAAAKQPTTPPVSPQTPEEDPNAARPHRTGQRGASRRMGLREENIEQEAICEGATYARWQKIAGIIQG